MSTVKEMVQTLKEALGKGRLVFVKPSEQPEIAALDDEGRYKYARGAFRASLELLKLLTALVDVGQGQKLEILSLFRTKNAGPHGILQSDGTRLGRAVDISAYGGFPIRLKHPANKRGAIQGVVKVVEKLPAG